MNRWMTGTGLPMHTRYLAVGGMAVLAALAVVSACVNPRIGYAPEQPVKFSHNVHVGDQEIPCTYCHTGVTEGPKASIPGADTCMNCHAQVEGQSAFAKKEIGKVKEAWKEGRPIRWVKVHDLPDHVQFSHQPHILQGFECSTCHGEIPKPSMNQGPGEVDRIAVENRFNMGWCVNCHRQPENDAPVDCVTCHY